MTQDYDLFDLGTFTLQGGVTLPAARLAYKTYGTLAPAKDNVILFPTAYGGVLADNAPRIGEGLALDPGLYFIIVIGLFGNSQSSSPSNTSTPYDGPRFPQVTIADNVRAQQRLVTEVFGISRIRLLTGFSMGALQSFEWAAAYPAMVERIAPICGAARCSRHNYVFLASLRAALTTDALWNGGDYTAKPVQGLKAFGRVYAGWAFSQAFYRQRLDMTALGFTSVDDFLERFWDELFQAKDANDLLTMVWTWQHADIADNARYGQDFEAALAAITAKAVIMPSATDLYFPVDDNVFEADHMPNARCVPIPTVWGHVAGNAGANAADTDFTNAHLRALLES